MRKVIAGCWLLAVLAGCGSANDAVREAADMTAEIITMQDDGPEMGTVQDDASETEMAEEDTSGDTSEMEAVQDDVSGLTAVQDAEAAPVEKRTGMAGQEDAGSSTKEKRTEKGELSAEDAKASGEKDVSVQEEETAPSLEAHTVEAYGESRIMYASSAVNIRKGPSTDFERTGGLQRGAEVTVTGQADTGWYEILHKEEKAYVSNQYLQEEAPPEEPAPVQASTGAGVILVGDSRFVQMQQHVGDNSCVWIAESAKGYKWFQETALAQIDGAVGNGSRVLINLGVNDVGNAKQYAELVNAKAAEWVSKGAKVYYASVNPVWENPYVTEEQVEYFNSQLKAALSGDVRWIDSHSYLDSIGYKLVDGLHYSPETYQNIYAYLMGCL